MLRRLGFAFSSVACHRLPVVDDASHSPNLQTEIYKQDEIQLQLLKKELITTKDLSKETKAKPFQPSEQSESYVCAFQNFEALLSSNSKMGHEAFEKSLNRKKPRLQYPPVIIWHPFTAMAEHPKLVLDLSSWLHTKEFAFLAVSVSQTLI